MRYLLLILLLDTRRGVVFLMLLLGMLFLLSVLTTPKHYSSFTFFAPVALLVLARRLRGL